MHRCLIFSIELTCLCVTAIEILCIHENSTQSQKNEKIEKKEIKEDMLRNEYLKVFVLYYNFLKNKF